MNKRDEFLQNLAKIEAVLPVYTERGDETAVYLNDGATQIVPNEIRAVLRRLAARQNKHLPAMLKNAQNLTGQAKNLPLGYSPSLVFARLKTREAKIRNDYTLGCINVAQPIEILPPKADAKSPKKKIAAGQAAKKTANPATGSEQAQIKLPSGRLVSVLWSEEATRNQIASARAVEGDLLKHFYRELFSLTKLPAPPE